MFMKTLVKTEMFDLGNYSAKSKFDYSNKLAVYKMKDKTADVAIK